MQGDEQGTKGLDELRVLVVDDHDLFRTGLRNLLEEQGVNVVGEAENGETAIRLASDLAPDVVIMDLNMPGARRSRDDAATVEPRSAQPRCRPDHLGRRR